MLGFPPDQMFSKTENMVKYNLEVISTILDHLVLFEDQADENINSWKLYHDNWPSELR